MFNPNGLLSQKVCHYLDQGRTLNGLLWSWQTKFSLNEYTENVRILIAMVTDVIKWHWGAPVSKCQIQNYQNKNRLSVCTILLLQRKPKLGRTKLSIGPHAARGLDIAELVTSAVLSSLSVVQNDFSYVALQITMSLQQLTS